jgi:hypothetical protein
MQEKQEKVALIISTVCIVLLVVAFAYLVITKKTIAFSGEEAGLKKVSSIFKPAPLFHANSSSVQPIGNTGDINTIFFGGRILTNPDSWSYRKTTKYRCPSIEFYIPKGVEEEMIMTVMDKTFCNPKDVVVPMSLEIIARSNLLFYIHTEKNFYTEMMELMMQSVQ